MPKGIIILPYTPRVSSPLNPTPTPPFSFSFSSTGTPLLDPDPDPDPEAPTVDELRRRHKRRPLSVWDCLLRTKGALAWRKTMISEGREMLEVEVEDGTGRFVYYTPPERRMSAVSCSDGGFVDDGAVVQSFCARPKRKGAAGAEGEVRGKSEVGELSSDDLEGTNGDAEGAVGRDTQYDEVLFWDMDGDVVDGEGSQVVGSHDAAGEEGRAIFDDFVEISSATPRIDTIQAASSDISTMSCLIKPDDGGPHTSPIATPNRRPPLRRSSASRDVQAWTLLRPTITTPEHTQPVQTPNGMTTPVRPLYADLLASLEAGPADRDAWPSRNLAYAVTAAAFLLCWLSLSVILLEAWTRGWGSERWLIG